MHPKKTAHNIKLMNMLEYFSFGLLIVLLTPLTQAKEPQYEHCADLAPQAVGKLCIKMTYTIADFGPPYDTEIVLLEKGHAPKVLEKLVGEMIQIGGFEFSRPNKNYLAVSWHEPGANGYNFYRTQDYLNKTRKEISLGSTSNNEIQEFSDKGIVVIMRNEFNHSKQVCQPVRHPVTNIIYNKKVQDHSTCLSIIVLR